MEQIQNLFKSYSEKLFAHLETDENLILQLKGEDSLFLRWNQGKVRQSTQVKQFEVSWTYQKNGRQLELQEQLTLNLDHDVKSGLDKLPRLRAEAQVLEASHQLAPLTKSESLISIGPTAAKDPAQIAQAIASQAAGLDLIGFWSSGPMVRAVTHSQGLFLFESRDSYFFDYSIFTRTPSGENKAVKGFFSDTDWKPETWGQRWGAQLQTLKDDVARLQTPSQRLRPGKYKVYLAPSALAAILDTMKYGSFSLASHKRGYSPMKELIEGRAQLSNKLTMTENFGLGFAPRFNRFGEVSPLTVPLIEKGLFKNALVSGKTAREYNVPSNGAEDGGWATESPRSLEVAAGDLKTAQAMQTLGTGVWINEVHYTNLSDLKSARITGMTRYACFWVENGQIVAPIEDMRFDISLYSLLGEGLLQLTEERQDLLDTGTYHMRSWAGQRVPGLLAKDFEFTL